jgi:hypothetical protein
MTDYPIQRAGFFQVIDQSAILDGAVAQLYDVLGL